ncbi:hypothetical protein SSX86_018733 [Deinandra increscens subsp. villosa]|uniref:Uncharacterized protein n=1 Tax=Deinandra increscens subsp. villosa TaxID=3103831 RepID=A0AAP0CSW0_9ASTR
MRGMYRSGGLKKSNGTAKLIVTTIMGVVVGYFIGVSFPSVSLTKVILPSSIYSPFDVTMHEDQSKALERSFPENLGSGNTPETPKIFVPTNPRGAESLPPGIVVPETDLYLRRLWGEPSEDLKKKPKYLLTFTVGWGQRNNIDASIKKFSGDFQILLFHYDGLVTEWDQYEWSKQAIHISVKKQTKWWYAKRFLHPDIVAAYDYIFIWDEDLGAEHFNADKYIQLVKKHGLEISQPGLEPNNGLTWQMTKRRGDKEVHKDTEEKPGWCSDPHLPPCAAFVEIMAPVFSRSAWRCVWHMIQPSAKHSALQMLPSTVMLIFSFFVFYRMIWCMDGPAHEKIGVVDSQWIIHQVVPSLGSQGKSENGEAPWKGVRDRCRSEWALFQDRLANADKAYFKQIGKED